MTEIWTTMIVNIVYISEKAIVPFYFVLTENKMIFLTIHVFGSGCPFFYENENIRLV